MTIWTQIVSLALGASVNFAPDEADPTRVVVRGVGISETANATLTLHLVGGEKPRTAMFGSVKREGDAIEFRPAVKLSRGQVYRAILSLGEADPITADYRVPTVESPTPRLTAIFPTSQRVPANLLKFYLYFDQPMREGRAIFDQVHIVDDTGKAVDDPWRRQELWTDDARRLTIWIHPGRIKRGVNLREDLGPVLHPNRDYELVIDATVRSAASEPLEREIRHKFTTIAEDYERPLPETWTLTEPKAGTRDPLRVESPEPLDHALIWRHVSVRGPSGELLPTKVDVDEGERSWFIEPAEPWASGEHRLVIGNLLEDLAGNTPLRVFDTDLTDPEIKAGAESIPFTPKS